MRVVWNRGEARVQEVVDALEPERPLAYTTVMTVMSRLAEKGLLTRRRDGRAYVYTSTTSHEATVRPVLTDLVDRLYAGSRTQAVEHLIETDVDVDDAELGRLENLIRAKRREQSR